MPPSLPSPLLYAHRGAAAELPENTLASFRRGLELGAGALEMDVHLTADGQVVVSHDPDGERLAGVVAQIRRSTLSEVQRWDVGRRFVSPSGQTFAEQGHRIPTFEEVLRAFPGVPINVDIKQHSPSMVEPLLALLRRERAEERVLLASFHSGTLVDVRRRGYAGSTALGQTEVLRFLALPRRMLSWLPRRGDAAQLPTRIGSLSLATRAVVDKCHALGLRVDYWTVNDPEHAEALLALGADGIMTDDPAAIAPVFRARAARR